MTLHQFAIEVCWFALFLALFGVILLMAWLSGKSEELQRGITDADEDKNG